MKKFLSLILAALLVLSVSAALAEITIAVPNDPTNEGRALLLLQANGLITLDPEAGVTATAADIIDNPLGIEFYEVDAAMVPMIMVDVDYAIINNNYALDFGLNPVQDSLLIESAESPYANVLCVNAGNENSDAAKALAAALNSQRVAEYITGTYGGAAVSVVAEPTDGYDPTVDYDALAGTTLVVGASPVPHAEILEVAKEILAAKGIELEVMVFSDYVMPNLAVDAGEIFANYFAHIPYQENFNEENGTNIVVVAAIHVEPMGLYGGQQTDLSLLGLPAAE